MKVLLLSVFVLLAVAQTPATQQIEYFEVGDGSAPGQPLGAPWNNPSNLPQHYYADGPTDFWTIPARYGFILSGTWVPPQDPSFSPPATYVYPSSMWFRLCDVTARSDDFTLAVWLGDQDCAPYSCPNTIFSLQLVGQRDDGTWSVVQNASRTNLDGNCISDLFTFNLGAVKAAYPGGVYLRLKNNDLEATSGNLDFDIRVARVGAGWDPSTGCSSDVAAAYADCGPFIADPATCDDGVYQPESEDCDPGLSTDCLPNCLCPVTMVSDGEGDCTSCGNGDVEPLIGEKCDRLLDENCGPNCTACNTGWVFDSNGVCIQCGNGKLDAGEQCDSAVSEWCTSECVCEDGYLPDNDGGCTLCGNGVLDAGEFCDSSSNKCNSQCTACARGYIVRPISIDPTGSCSLCGNGLVDAGEVCDFAQDFNCKTSCDGCVDTLHLVSSSGVCTRCGNGLLDAGEECDSLREGCKSDCSGCGSGLVPSFDKYGTCGTCGNGIVEPDEVCDTGVDKVTCAPDCNGCAHPYYPVNRRCVLCGNGRLDVVRDDDGNVVSAEVCDAVQLGCRDDCSGCEDGYVAADDASGSCVPACTECCTLLSAIQGGDAPADVSPAGTLFVPFVLVFSGLLVALH